MHQPFFFLIVILCSLAHYSLFFNPLCLIPHTYTHTHSQNEIKIMIKSLNLKLKISFDKLCNKTFTKVYTLKNTH